MFDSFISTLKKNGRFFIITSTIFGKISGLLLSLIIVRFLSKEVYGNVNFAKSFIAMFVPFVGMGANISLLYFGSQLKNDNDKNTLYRYALKYGVFLSSITFFIINIGLYIFKDSISNYYIYIVIQSFEIITLAFMTISQSQLRILKLNRKYAINQMINSALILIMGVLLTFLGGGIGLSVSYALVPIIVFLLVHKNIRTKKNEVDRIENFDKSFFWKYGMVTGIGSIASRLLYSVDILMLGFMLNNPVLIAEYKVASILPQNLLFIPNSFFVADFVSISENKSNKSYLNKYVLNTSLLMFIISIVFSIFIFLFGEIIIITLFGSDYINSLEILKILSIGLIGSFSLRIPMGNVLSALGKANWNAVMSYITLVTAVILNLLLIPNYGALGAAYATTFSMWLSGIIGIIMYKLYIFREFS
jgi:O-antigen/teichoic acid export membrane protein